MSTAAPKNTDLDLALKFARLKCDSDPEAYIWEYRNLHLALGLSDAANTSPKSDLVMGAIFVSNLPEPVQKRMDMSLMGNMTDLIWEAFQASETEREWQRFKAAHPDAVEEDDDESVAASDVDDLVSTGATSPSISVPSTPEITQANTNADPVPPSTPKVNIPQATSRHASNPNTVVSRSSSTTTSPNPASQADGINPPKIRQMHSRSSSQSVISTTPLSELRNSSMNGNNGSGPRRIESRHKRTPSNVKPVSTTTPPTSVTYGGVGVGQIPSFSPAIPNSNGSQEIVSRSRSSSLINNNNNNNQERKPSCAKRPNGKFTHTGRLTSKEKARRQEKGLCLYCAKPGHSRPQCPVLHEKANAGTRKLKHS